MTIKIKKLFLFIFLAFIAVIYVGCRKTLPTEIKINNEKMEFLMGEEVTISYTVLPEEVEDKSVSFKSNNEEIATVSESGLVKFLKEGSVTITVTANANTSVTKEIAFTIKTSVVMPNSIELECKKQMKVSEQLEIKATVKPDNATNKEVTWETSDLQIASVNNGVVTALKTGKVTITCKSVANPEITKSVEIEIIEDVYDASKLSKDLQALINSYLQSTKGSIEIETRNGEEFLGHKYGFELENGNLVKFYRELSGDNVSSIYVKDGIIYMNANGVKVQYEGDESEIQEVYDSSSISKVLGDASAFYLEAAFYDALKYEGKSDDVITYSLDIRNYKGDKLNTLNKDEIKILVTMENNVIVKVECVSVSEGKEQSLVIKFLGLDFKFEYPSDLNEYPLD